MPFFRAFITLRSQFHLHHRSQRALTEIVSKNHPSPLTFCWVKVYLNVVLVGEGLLHRSVTCLLGEGLLHHYVAGLMGEGLLQHAVDGLMGEGLLLLQRSVAGLMDEGLL